MLLNNKIIQFCNNKHDKCCLPITKHLNDNIDDINILNEDTFNKYINFINGNQAYSFDSCLSLTPIKNNSDNILNFIIKVSKKFKISLSNIALLVNSISDLNLLEIIKHQEVLDSDYITKLYNNNDIKYNFSLNTGNFILSLLCTRYGNKNKTFSYLIYKLNLDQVINLFKKSKQVSVNISVEEIIIKYIQINSQLLIDKKYYNELINIFISKPKIIKEIYSIICNNINIDIKKEILLIILKTIDLSLITLILEDSKIIPDIDLLSNLFKKTNFNPKFTNYNNSRISEMIDILIIYGLIITKELILILLENGCYINNIYKYNIQLDDDIEVKCSKVSYYPYIFTKIPCLDVLKFECSKENNIDIIKKLKERGGEFTSECLENACLIRKNGKVINYLVNECKVKVNDNCILNFETCYNVESLQLLIKKYSKDKPDTTEQQITKKINLDEDSLIKVQNKYDNFVIEYDKKFILKKKVCSFLKYKKDIITYNDLYQLFLNYLINSNLVIADYIIINVELSKLLKIDKCVIMNINQVHNILSYFIQEI